MENGPFIEDFPIKTSIYEGFSMASGYRYYHLPWPHGAAKNDRLHGDGVRRPGRVLML